MDDVFSYLFLPAEVSDVTAYSPWFEANCSHHRMIVALEFCNEVNLVRLATADRLGCHVVPCERRLRLADSSAYIHVVGVTFLSIERGGSVFPCEAVVVEALGVDVIAGRPFVRDYDISFRAATRQVFFPGGTAFVYETPIPPHSGVGSHIASVRQAPRTPPSAWKEEECGPLLSEEEFDAPPSEEEFDAPPS